MTAAVLCFVFVVWPVIAFVGGLAFAPLTGLAAIVTSPVSLPRLRIRIYTVVLLAFFAYAAASTLWSPQPIAFVSIDLPRGVFAVKSEVLRVGLALLAGGALIAATQSMSDRSRDLLGKVATWALVVQLISVIVLALFERQAISFFYGTRPDDEGVQNISRNSQIVALCIPFLVMGLTKGRGRIATIAIAAVVVGAEAAVLIAREVDAGLLSLVLAGICMATVWIFKRNGFRILGGLIAVLIMTAPFVFQYISHGANAITATNSIEYRQAIWQRVLEIMQDNPVFGSGVGVLRTHRDMIPEGVFANLYYIPNHAHNMLLQLWVETGVIGAILMSATVVLVAFRLPRPEVLGVSALRVAAIVGGIAAAWVSFDLWNEWWWAVASLLAVLTASQYRPRADATAG